MADSTEVAVIDLTNTTEAALVVSLVVGEAVHEIVTLQPGETTRQVTPSGVSWRFSAATAGAEKAAGAGQTSEGEIDGDGGDKGGGRTIRS
ncbi:MAG: hypothetical protein AAF547_12555 [Actinomycetota bacterium]